MQSIVRASLGRIAKFGEFEIRPVDRKDWKQADYAVAEVTDAPGPNSWVEVRSGRMIQVIQGDRILGAFGNRYATLELTQVSHCLTITPLFCASKGAFRPFYFVSR